MAWSVRKIQRWIPNRPSAAAVPLVTFLRGDRKKEAGEGRLKPAKRVPIGCQAWPPSGRIAAPDPATGHATWRGSRPQPCAGAAPLARGNGRGGRGPPEQAAGLYRIRRAAPVE